MTDLATSTTDQGWLPPAFDPRGLCPTLARVAFIAWREERTRRVSDLSGLMREMDKRLKRATP